MSIYLDTSQLRRGITPEIIDKQNKLIRKKGPALSFGQPDIVPLGEVFVEVVGEPESVGAKTFTPKIRGVFVADGDHLYIDGGQGAPVQFEDAQRLLHAGERRKVTTTMGRTAERMRRKLTNATKS